uniref:Glyco_hydro_92 n=1 Tax=uncultured Chitinophaga sp. TaxID=339340 RepID=A0A060C2P6_9BACT|nr:Glyco_hydro_92 [uncultured Chitinophaga sp.]
MTLENKITTEIAPSERGAHLRFRFPEKHKSFLILDGYTGLSGIRIYPSENKITGYVNNGRGFQPGWKNYFVIRFDKPILEYGTWENRKNTLKPDNRDAEGEGLGAFLRFEDGASVQVKVASSYISMEQAALNLERELGADKTVETNQSECMEDLERPSFQDHG